MLHCLPFILHYQKGALLADEVGLGKTIEAGIVISQKWAERKRKILIIAPANLRKQWNQEIADKFFLPSIISKQSHSIKKLPKPISILSIKQITLLFAHTSS
jgi:SNF2 family DNA or RNA helicase